MRWPAEDSGAVAAGVGADGTALKAAEFTVAAVTAAGASD